MCLYRYSGAFPIYGETMVREKFADFLKQLKNAKENGQNVDAIVKKHEHENVYFYNDKCIKKILANEKNLILTTDLINAALNLIGSDRIENPKLVHPLIPGELGYRSVEPDILLTNDRKGNRPRDRISIEVQHNGNLYNDRLVLYVARLTSNMMKQGDVPRLENLNVISFQFFDTFPKSDNYLHKVQLKNQEQQVYFDKQTVTLIEVEKFFKKAQMFANDNSRLAQWLRAIDTLNRGDDFNEFVNDPIFKILQNEVKISNFSSRYLMNISMHDFDEGLAKYEKALEIAKKLRDEGVSIEIIQRTTGLFEKEIRELK